MRFMRLFRAARLTTVLFLSLALVAPAVAAPPVFNGSVNVPSTGSATIGTALPSTLMCADANKNLTTTCAQPTPPPTATLVFTGDSITYGKSPTGTYCASNHSGTCWADLVTTAYNATEVNLGTTGSLLSIPNNAANCTLSGGTAFMSSYTTSWAGKMGANYWHYIEFGTNDANCNDPNLTPQQYHDDLTTLVHYLNTNGTPNNQITIIGPISQNTANTNVVYGQARLLTYNAQAAKVAVENPGVRFVSLYGIIANNGGVTIQDDGLHPSCTTNPNACALIATAVEGSTQFNAISAMRGWEAAGALLDPNASANGHTPFVWTDLPVTITGADTFSSILTDSYGYKTLGSDPGIASGDVIFGRNSTGSSGGAMWLGGSATWGEFTFNVPSANTWELQSYYSGAAQQANLLLANNGCFESGSAYLCNNALNTGNATVTSLQPNGSSNGYAAETRPLGVKSQHPVWVSGTCAVTAPSTACVFPNSFSFVDTTFLCTFSIEGATPQNAPTYDTKLSYGMTVHLTSSATVDYQCLR